MEINPNTLEIEIVNVEPIEGGVQVFARAWSNGQQIGFGSDGTVDIERFRFFNPPVLVDDPNGDIVRGDYVDEISFIYVPLRRLREDPEEAILQLLSRTITQVAKDDVNIIQGKTGSTVSTFSSATGSSSPIDGLVQRSVSSETWTQTRDGTGTLTNATSDFQFAQGEFCAVCGNRYIITRNVLLFDTSAIPDSDTINSATITVTSSGTGDSTNGDSSNFYSVVTASTSALANSDYDKANWGTTAYSTAKSLSTLVTAGAYTWTLNSSGIAAISKTGISYFGERSTNDASNSTPASRGYVLMRSVDFTGTANDPVLTVDHSAAGGASTPLLMLMGMGS